MRTWQSILLTITLAVCLVAGAISISFKLAPILVTQAQIVSNIQELGRVVNAQAQQIQQLQKAPDKK